MYYQQVFRTIGNNGSGTKTIHGSIVATTDRNNSDDVADGPTMRTHGSVSSIPVARHPPIEALLLNKLNQQFQD